MEFFEILAQVLALVEREGRVSYRALKRQFALDDDYIEDLKSEIIDAKRLAVDEDGKVLVWMGAAPVLSAESRVLSLPQPSAPSSQPLTPNTQPLAAYAPQHLAQRILAEHAAQEAAHATDGERKTITVLFADIKGSMSLIEDLDPEDAKALIDPTLQFMMDAVQRYEGFVAQSTGDGIFAFFGAPLAAEDHPQRAVYAALLMQQESQKFAERLRREKGVNLQIRIGLNTGEAVLRSVHKDRHRVEYVPVGHSVSLAARLQTLATPGAIVASDSTYKLTEGYFTFKPLGEARVKGVSDPIHVHEVVGVGPLRTRLQMSARRGLLRFVGRQHEMDVLRRALEQARTGHGQIVAVMGEPGVGKSRLCHEFKLLSQTACLVLEAFSVAHGKNYPYLPLVDLLKNYFQIAPPDDERRRREKVMGRVLALDRALESTLPSLFSLLGIAEPSATLQDVDPRVKRQRIFEAVKQLLVRESLNQPLVLLFEDLQWLDAETQDFLVFLSESLASARVLLLVNYRPEYQHGWGNRTYYTQIRLDPLKQEDAEAILTTLLGEDPAGSAPSPLRSLKRLILEKTEGNPFFIEEIVRALFEQEILARDPNGVFLVGDVTDIQLPPTVQGVLASRIDRLDPEAKDLLQTLAVIGKEFPASLLRHVVTLPETRVQGLLARLQTEEFIYEQPAFPEVSYTFKHGLTQEVAYHSLLMEHRRTLHEQVARGIEQVFAGRLEDHYSELAHHYSQSGNNDKAIEHLQQAARQAIRRSAYAEAIRQLTTALELLNTLLASPERDQRELTLQIALGVPLIMTRGYGVPEVMNIYARARELYEQLDGTQQLLPELFSLWRFYFVRGAYRIAHEMAARFPSLIENEHDPLKLLPGQLAMGSTFFRLGEFATAREHLEEGIRSYELRPAHFNGVEVAALYGAEPGVMTHAYAAWVLAHLGHMDQALQRSHEAITLAHAASHPFSLAYAMQFAATVHRLRREAVAAQERAEAVIALANEQGFPYWAAAGIFVRGWALAEQGQLAEGKRQMYRGIDAWRAIGIQTFGQPSLMLAEVCGKMGATDEGFRLLEEALAEVRQSGERWWEAELHRVRGELWLSTEPHTPPVQHSAEAESCFREAIDLARQQHAKWAELRATISLSRLHMQQDKHAEAHAPLAAIYGWFTEGTDTADVQEAKRLLEELGET